MAKSEESADKQLQLMNTIRSINVPEGYQRHETSDRPLILAQVDRRPAGIEAQRRMLHVTTARKEET